MRSQICRDLQGIGPRLLWYRDQTRNGLPVTCDRHFFSPCDSVKQVGKVRLGLECSDNAHEHLTNKG
jgi:hypothetical protein